MNMIVYPSIPIREYTKKERRELAKLANDVLSYIEKQLNQEDEQ